jgi:hypothetical protein
MSGAVQLRPLYISVHPQGNFTFLVANHLNIPCEKLTNLSSSTVCIDNPAVDLLLYIIHVGEHNDVMISLNMHAMKLENFWQNSLMH